MPGYKDSPEVRAAKQERREKLQELPCSFRYYANMARKPIFAFHAIHHFAFLYRTLEFTHNLKKTGHITLQRS